MECSPPEGGLHSVKLSPPVDESSAGVRLPARRLAAAPWRCCSRPKAVAGFLGAGACPKAGSSSVESVHPVGESSSCSTRKTTRCCFQPRRVGCWPSRFARGPKAPLLAGSSGPCCPRAAGSEIVGLPLGCPRATKRRRLPVLRRAPTVDHRRCCVPRDPAPPRRAVLPEGSPSAIGLCEVAACLPKGAGRTNALPLPVASRGSRLSVACVLLPRVRSAGESLRLLRGAASHRPASTFPREGLFRVAGVHRSPLRRVGCCFPCDRSGLPKKIRRSGQTRHRFNRVATRGALPEGGASPARGLFPFAVSVVRRRLPVAWWSVLARGLSSPRGGLTAFQS